RPVRRCRNRQTAASPGTRESSCGVRHGKVGHSANHYSAPMPQEPARVSIAAPDRLMRHELYLLALYRTLEAAMLALAVFGPLQGVFGGDARDPALAAAVAATYLVASGLLLVFSRRAAIPLPAQVVFGVLIDIAVATLATH